ncbi:MAG: 50S ribosomal protein L5 [Gammaproteobacteria bacterium]|nr:50S ribosomal protein L5 [Gammaproteobacteria bacterium]
MNRLHDLYIKKLIKQLMKQLGYKNVMQVPKLEKITLNIGLGETANDKKVLDAAVSDLTKISGQKAIVTYARKSIAGFKIRKGWPIGCKVTLRRERMYEFLDRLMSIAIPRIRYFRGYSVRAFDGRGNFSIGIDEQIVFTEIDYDKIDQIRGLDIAFTTTATSDRDARALLSAFQFPFKEDFNDRKK